MDKFKFTKLNKRLKMDKLLKVTEIIFTPVLNFITAEYIKIRPFVIILIFAVVFANFKAVLDDKKQLENTLYIIETLAPERKGNYAGVLNEILITIKQNEVILNDMNSERASQ